MSKPKAKLKLAEAEAEATPKITTLVFDDRDFEIHPMSDREDDFVYDDSSEFLILAVPLASRILGELVKLGDDHNGSLQKIVEADPENLESMVGALMNIVKVLSDAGLQDLIREITETLPKLAAIALHYTDTDVRVMDVRRWVKTPISPKLWRVVVAQVRAEDLMGQFGQLQEIFSEFSAAA